MASASSAPPRRALQRGGRQQAAQAVVEFVLGQHAAGGVQAGQQRVDAGLFQRPGGARRNVAGDDLHRPSSSRGRAGGDQARASAPPAALPLRQVRARRRRTA
jgi:hypothetical protein